MEEAIQQYHKNHEVEYIMLVKVDGETIIKQTSEQSFDDVASCAAISDEAMQRHIIADANDAAEYKAEAEAEAQMEAERGN